MDVGLRLADSLAWLGIARAQILFAPWWRQLLNWAFRR
jgi:hypothetical protein